MFGHLPSNTDPIYLSSLLKVNQGKKVVDTFDYTFGNGFVEPDNQGAVHVEHNRYSFNGERLCGSSSTCHARSIAIDPATARVNAIGFKDTFALTLATSNVRVHRFLTSAGYTAPKSPPCTRPAPIFRYLITQGVVIRFDDKTAELTFHPQQEDYDPPSGQRVLRGTHQVWKDMHIHRLKDVDNNILININAEHESATGKGRG
jgi:hypothetical protein